jgi:iron-sulfur cluster assembly protein CyaY
MTLTDQEFRVRSDDALEQTRRALLPLADEAGFEEPGEAKFVVSPNAPVRQIWVSAMARSYKLAWSSEKHTFALDGETLPQLLERLARAFLDS